MHTVLSNRARWAPPARRPSRLATALALAAATCAVIAIGLVIAMQTDHGTVPAGADAPVVDARPLIDSRASAERFHHRLGGLPAGAAEVDPPADSSSGPNYIHLRGQGFVAP